MTLAMELI
jgi:hypothetical protein